MNKQEIIDTINEKFTGQAVNDKFGTCQYLTEDGRKCAIGMFIPDGHPAQHKITDVISLLNEYPDLGRYMPFDNLNTLNKFQDCHDSCLDTEMSLEEQKQILIDFVNEVC